MSSNARWRRFKIVDTPSANRAEEIIGGLKNALDRGETLDKAKQSFISAGYRLDEVESAVQKVPSIASKISKPLVDQAPSPGKTPSPSPESQTKPLPSSAPKEGKQASKGLIIALVVVGVLVLAGAAFVGIFWDSLF